MKELKQLSAAEYVFLDWLQRTHPKLYADAEVRQKGISGFLDSFGNVLDSISKATPDVLKQYVSGQQDLAVLQENLARAKAGALPLSSAGGMVYTPNSNPLAGVPAWAWAVLGVGAVLLITRSR